MMKKNILVTGGAGFIGTNFIYHALKIRPAWQITNLDALTYAGNPANFDNLPDESAKRHMFVHGDIKDKNLINKLFKEKKFNGIIHFAAQSHVDRSIQDPEIFVDTNIVGTQRLLDASYRYWKDSFLPADFRFLHVSTDEVYGSLGKNGFFTETTPYNPSSPYSASKAASDHLVRAYFKTYDFPTLITNCSNNYGHYQFPEKFIPLMILNLLEQKSLPVYGNGENVRDWLYVIDHCDALVTVFEMGKPGETYNIGGNSERKNIEIAHALCDFFDKTVKIYAENSSRNLIRFVKDRPGHDLRYAIDASKIKEELGWTPKFSFEKALEDTVRWYLSNKKWVKSVKSGEYRKWIKASYGKTYL